MRRKMFAFEGKYPDCVSNYCDSRASGARGTGSNNCLRSNDCESGKNSQFAIITRSQTLPSYGIALWRYLLTGLTCMLCSIVICVRWSVINVHS